MQWRERADLKKRVGFWGQVQQWIKRLWSRLMRHLPFQSTASRRRRFSDQLADQFNDDALSTSHQQLVDDRLALEFEDNHHAHHDRRSMPKLNLPKPNAPFVLGLEEIQDLERFSSGDLLQELPWMFGSGSTIETLDSLDSITMPLTESLSTEAMLEQVQWDFQLPIEPDLGPAAMMAPEDPASGQLEVFEEVNPLPSFLLGLEDLPNLDRCLTQDLLQAVEWRIEAKASLIAEEEDIRILEDLLVEFPE